METWVIMELCNRGSLQVSNDEEYDRPDMRT